MRLPNYIKSKLGTSEFLFHVKAFYKSRCQHAETTRSSCLSCKRSESIYKESNDSNIHNATELKRFYEREAQLQLTISNNTTEISETQFHNTLPDSNVNNEALNLINKLLGLCNDLDDCLEDTSQTQNSQ